MKKIPIIATLLLPLCTMAATETVPAIMVSHKAGADSYYVHLSAYNRIDIDDANNQYTLVRAKETDEDGAPLSNVTLSAKDYPILALANISKDVVTSVESVAEPQAENALRYCAETSTFTSSGDETLRLTIYNLTGQPELAAELMPGHSVSVAALPEGIHIALATGCETTITLKFIK